jgi:putative glycosyltransferase (TIGR04348 family)
MLRELGHRVAIEEQYSGRSCAVLVALHARRSYASIARFRREHPKAPLIVALTGTDLYGDLRSSRQARRSIELASRLIVLQPLGVEELPARIRGRARVILQSAERPRGRIRPRKRVWEVCVMGHLRPVKDPFRAARAARRLPRGSRIRIVQIGGALSDGMKRIANAEMRANPRYDWRGELPRGEALRMLARSRVHVLSSRMEGGANALSEAIACGVPTLASRIPGSVGILGRDYPGYFPAGDTDALAGLLRRAETDTKFLGRLRKACKRLQPLVRPAREREAWRMLLEECAA